MDEQKTWYEEYPELEKFKDDPISKLPSRIRRIIQERKTAAFLDKQRELRNSGRTRSRRTNPNGGQNDGTSRKSR